MKAAAVILVVAFLCDANDAPDNVRGNASPGAIPPKSDAVGSEDDQGQKSIRNPRSGAPDYILEYFINAYRAIHGSPAITLDSELKAKAQTCADYYQLKKEMTRNSNADADQPRTICPEKLPAFDIYGVAGNRGLDQITLIDKWYRELTVPREPATARYDYDNPDVTTIFGYNHALQLLWAGVNKCGCAISNKPIEPTPPENCSGDPPNTVKGPPENGNNNISPPDNGGIPPDNSDSPLEENENPVDDEQAPLDTVGFRRRKRATSDKYVHVCVCDVSPGGRKNAYVANIKAPVN